MTASSLVLSLPAVRTPGRDATPLDEAEFLCWLDAEPPGEEPRRGLVFGHGLLPYFVHDGSGHAQWLADWLVRLIALGWTTALYSARWLRAHPNPAEWRCRWAYPLCAGLAWCALWWLGVRHLPWPEATWPT